MRAMAASTGSSTASGAKTPPTKARTRTRSGGAWPRKMFELVIAPMIPARASGTARNPMPCGGLRNADRRYPRPTTRSGA